MRLEILDLISFVVHNLFKIEAMFTNIERFFLIILMVSRAYMNLILTNNLILLCRLKGLNLRLISFYHILRLFLIFI